MPAKILLSTAYLPPAGYFAKIRNAENILIEREENYIKQSYRNRCYILTASGLHPLSVPVYLGSFHKTPLRDIRIDYSKRWQQIHLRAITAAYGSSPFFIYYFESIEKALLSNHEFLLDLNMDLLTLILSMLKLDAAVSYTGEFIPPGKDDNDFRYSISPKKETEYIPKQYMKVFPCEGSDISRLSIIDLLFNQGPESVSYI